MAVGRRLCASSQLVERGDGVRFELAGPAGPASAFAVRFEGVVRAYFNRCAHVGVELDWEPGRFFDEEGRHLICATHGALYRPEDGYCMAGPCRGRALEPVGVEESGGNVYLADGNR